MNLNVRESELLLPELKVLDEYLVYDGWQKATEDNSRTLSTLAGEIAIDSLPAIRRIRELFQDSHTVPRRRLDIHSDRVAFENVPISIDALSSGLDVLEQLNITFFPQIEDICRKLAGRYRRVDPVDALLVTQEEVRRRIFYNWNADGRSSEELAWNLTGFVKIAFKYASSDLIRLDRAASSDSEVSIDFDLVGTGRTSGTYNDVYSRSNEFWGITGSR